MMCGGSILMCYPATVTDMSGTEKRSCECYETISAFKKYYSQRQHYVLHYHCRPSFSVHPIFLSFSAIVRVCFRPYAFGGWGLRPHTFTLVLPLPHDEF